MTIDARNPAPHTRAAPATPTPRLPEAAVPTRPAATPKGRAPAPGLADRLRTSMLVLVSASLLCATLVLCVAEYFEALEERREYAESMAHLVAEGLEAALVFRDHDAAREALEALHKEASIVAAFVHTVEGPTIAQYTRSEQDRDRAPGGDAHADEGHTHALEDTKGDARFEQALDTLSVTVPVHDGDSTLGYVHLTVSMQPAYASMALFSAVTAAILLAVFLASIPFARRIGAHIVAPLGQLAGTMTDIAARKDFATRAHKVHADEVGTLVDRFNELLGQLQDRDAMLMSRQVQLESEVAARTRELVESNESLRAAVVEVEEARDAAQQASEAKGQFLANMSHEIRSPLNGVIGMAELLRNTRLDDRQAHFCRTIMASSKALLGVLNDVLDLSKIEAGSMQLERVGFDLLDLVEESVQLFAENAARNRVELVCATTIDRQLRVLGDPLRLRQVLINLLSNAVKFTEQGEVVLEVDGLASEGRPGHVRFSVRDTGIGMSDDVQARIFGAFEQADGSTSRRFGGTGLGLAISHRMVELLGGELEVRSHQGRGSTFSFDIPLEVEGGSRSGRTFGIRDARLIVLDGHTASAQSVQRYLLNWGARPTVVATLAAARSRCGQESQAGGFAAIIANYEQFDGGEDRLTQLRELAEAFGIACVVYSSVAAMATIDPATTRGIRLLAKPLRQSELFNALNELVQGPRSVDAQAAPRAAATLRPNARVLLVEDNPVNQEVAGEHLRDLGCEVTLANHGAEALAHFTSPSRQRPGSPADGQPARQRFDVVLMDCQMPVMDGYEATRSMRVWEQEQGVDGARTPIVALTANALKGDRDRCLVAGMDDFLPKPFRLDDLQAMLARWIPADIGDAATAEPGASTGPGTDAPTTASGYIDDAVWAQLQVLAQRSSGFLERVLGALCSEARNLRALLADDATPASELAFVAHRVKSAASSVGALPLAALLARIEQHARAAGDELRDGQDDGATNPSAVRSLAFGRLIADAQASLAGSLAELRARSGLALAEADPAEPTPPARDAQANESQAPEPQPPGAHAGQNAPGTAAAATTPGPASLPARGRATGEDAAVRVLVADDDVVSRSVVCGWLRADGYEVVEVEDGLAAQRAFAASQFDLVLLDVLMPNCDGFAACAAIRAQPGGRHVPIVMLTGLDDTESIHRAYEIGATDFLIKPVAEEILRHRLRYIHRAQAAAARLRESEERLRRAQNTARVSYWEWDPKTRRMRIGEGAQQLLALDPARPDFSLEEILPRILPEDRHYFAQLDAAPEQLPAHAEFRMLDRNGNELLLSQRLEHLVDEATGSERWLATVQDVTERRRTEQRIYRISHFDTVTGLPNQTLLRKAMQVLLQLSQRRASRTAYLVIDTGEQQLVASSLGHEYNDRFLLELANRLRTQLRGSDLVAPLSEPGSEPRPDDPRAALVHGDRFAAVLSDVGDNDDVTRLCSRLVAALAEPIALGEEALFPTVNIGIAVFPEDGDDYETLHQHALTALSQRTATAGSGWHWYQHERDAAARERIALERDLRYAVERGELRVFYQPRVDARTGAAIGMEALVRWQRNGEYVSPARFVPIAEQTGVICQLGEQVLERSVAMLGAWLARGLPPLRVSVNVSGQQFRESNLAALCAAALDRFRVPGEYLELELTEGILIDASEQVLQQLQAVKALGVSLALDDFGTGFSSLAYLSRFPLDVLKIDRSFVDQLAEHRQNQVIVRSTLNLAHELGLTVVAEGVETEEQQAWLREHGCDELQGYLFSRPVPADEFEAWVLRQQPPGARAQPGAQLSA